MIPFGLLLQEALSGQIEICNKRGSCSSYSPDDWVFWTALALKTTACLVVFPLFLFSLLQEPSDSE